MARNGLQFYRWTSEVQRVMVSPVVLIELQGLFMGLDSGADMYKIKQMSPVRARYKVATAIYTLINNHSP